MGFKRTKSPTLWGLPLELWPRLLAPFRTLSGRARGTAVPTLQTGNPSLRESDLWDSRNADPRPAFPFGLPARTHSPGQAGQAGQPLLLHSSARSLRERGGARPWARTVGVYLEGGVC